VSLPRLLDVTTTSFTPRLEAGVVPVICVVLTTVRPTSSLPPMVTLVTSMKLVPVIVMLVPPAGGPVEGLPPEIASGGSGWIGSESPQPGASAEASRRATTVNALVELMFYPRGCHGWMLGRRTGSITQYTTQCRKGL
jgi:hypothetical protein